MGIRFSAAKASSALSTWALKHVFSRPAANFPGKLALYIDPQLIAHLKSRLNCGSVVVVGTNGKTTSTNMLANVIEASGRSVVCNRTGANLDSGVSTALLHTKRADWGVLESDELWLAKILPQLQANYVLLLNLFRDQLDRCGEIDRIQESIIAALKASPKTTLVYNADDPLCAYIASKVENASFAFGVKECMNLEQNTVSDAQMCQHCSSMFEYEFRQYGQLGKYRCPHCGFARPDLDFSAQEVKIGDEETSFVLAGDGFNLSVTSGLSGSYMVYNLAAVASLAYLTGCSPEALDQALRAFNPQNGRLQHYVINNRRTLLNLAKNPTGFNQNLRIVARDEKPKAVVFFINDKQADGHDISWIWDVDFEELATSKCVVYAGGLRKEDLQVRLKYAGIQAKTIDDAAVVFKELAGEGAPAAELSQDASVYFIANYTALPAVHNTLNALAKADAEGKNAEGADAESADEEGVAKADSKNAAKADVFAPTSTSAPSSSQIPVSSQTPTPAHNPNPNPNSTSNHNSNLTSTPIPTPTLNPEPTPISSEKPLVIAHLFPDLLNLYGDGGNVRILQQRCVWRGIPVEVKRVFYGESIDLASVDLLFLGGGPDREQRLASQELMRMKDSIASFVEEEGPVLAICGGYQILGKTWLLGDEEVEGLGIVNMETKRAGSSANRLIDNIVLDSCLAKHLVVGYENHAGRTYLDRGLQAFGKVVSRTGKGNNEQDCADGVLYKGVIGTYLHGTLLAKNPEVADVLLQRALDRRATRTNSEASNLSELALDDKDELAANAHMCKVLGCS